MPSVSNTIRSLRMYDTGCVLIHSIDREVVYRTGGEGRMSHVSIGDVCHRHPTSADMLVGVIGTAFSLSKDI